MPRVVVLLGPPGSGKSAIGEGLLDSGLRWRDWEAALVERWGSRDRFVAVKDVALPALHSEILDWVDSDETPAVVETTGLSDAPLVRTLVERGDTLVVRLDVDEDEAARRVGQRHRGRHLTDDEAPNRAVWRAFHERVAPTTHADIVFDTQETSVPSMVAVIVEHLGG